MKLVFATNNLNKLAELKALVPGHIEILSLKDIGCHADIPETENTLKGNAYLKADYVYKKYGLSCFAEDTGLAVDALTGAPGVYSARYAGENCTSEDNINKLLIALKNESNRKANFETVIALILDGNKHDFSGSVSGEITSTKSGIDGFGYDPIFKPNGYNITFAEMNRKEKGAISHRGLAVVKLVKFLENLN